MKNTFYRSERMDFAEIDKLILDLKANFEECVSGAVKADEWELFILKHLKNQDEKGFWGLIDPRGAASDARVAWFYVPTYYSTAILMKFYMNDSARAKAIEGFENALAKGLMASTGRSFSGSGYDANAGAIMAMDIFCQAGAARFIEEHGEICPAFKELVEHIVKIFREAIATGNTKIAWGGDNLADFKRIVKYFEAPEEDLIVFVYGTLMQGKSNHANYLSESEFRGEAVLHDYALYDLGSFPGIKPYTDEKVKGELYKITPYTLQRLNQLEGEGSLYNLKSVEVEVLDGGKASVLTYEYNHKVDEGNRIPFYNQPWDKKEMLNPEEYVWYASYGSNMLIERFRSYIEGGICRFNGKMYIRCEDVSSPKDIKPVMIPYKMYFGNEVSSWGKGGVSFLNQQAKGESYGRMYLITRKQFEHVHFYEGEGDNWYNEILEIGVCEGIPIQTITNKALRKETTPGEKYLTVLYKGMKETYPRLSDKDIQEYIKGSQSI